jgi:ABC-2 type transport system ATP-binding protein
LEVHGLTKSFGSVTAVDDLSFGLQRGEVMGFLGPNGSGKSTTVSMILGLVRPTKGSVAINGEQLKGQPGLVANNIGAIIENPAFYPYLSGRDNLRALAMMAGKVDDGRIQHLLDLVNMADRGDRPYKTFSLGMKQRIGIAATLITNPAIVILDEPTNGLDPAGQREIREIIPRLAHEGHAVLLASHLLHEVEQVSDRVTIIQKGKFIRAGRVEELLQAGSAIEVVLDSEQQIPPAVNVLRQQNYIQEVKADGATLTISAPLEASSAVNRALAEAGIFASQVSIRRNSLESLFLELTENEPAAA